MDKVRVSVDKLKIPKALREQVWLKFIGRKYESKCYVRWCVNKMTVFDFHVGHNIPQSKGGLTQIDNLRPICSRCNLSMGHSFTIDEWAKFGKMDIHQCCWWSCFKS